MSRTSMEDWPASRLRTHRFSPLLSALPTPYSMAIMNFITANHTKTKRNYLERALEHDKAACAAVAVQYGRDYWDGERKYGYGGFRYNRVRGLIVHAMPPVFAPRVNPNDH